MTNTMKAKTVTILIGDQEVECLVMPNGEYKIGFSQVARLFAVPLKHASESFKSLLPKEFQYPKVKTDIQPRAVPVLSLSQFGMLTCMLSAKGNKLATAHLAACQAEIIESRIDDVLEIEREIKEKNERFIARKDSILQRFFWTDCIKWWLDNNEVSDNTRKFIYSNVSNKLNKAMFGMTAKEIRTQLDADKSEAVRDLIDPSYLPDVTFLEKYAGTRVRQGLTPMQAIDEAIVFMQIKPTDPAKKN